MKKMIVVDNCVDCPYSYWNNICNPDCKMLKISVNLPLEGIHPDCPLPDAQNNIRTPQQKKSAFIDILKEKIIGKSVKWENNSGIIECGTGIELSEDGKFATIDVVTYIIKIETSKLYIW